jgi:uncharacterized protein YlxP (DUF503 family)
MVVGVGRAQFIIHHSESLKDKRHVVKKLVMLVHNRFNAACAEVADGDLWQKATIGFTVVGNDTGFVNSHLDKIINFMELFDLAEMIDHSIEIISYSDGDFL